MDCDIRTTQTEFAKEAEVLETPVTNVIPDELFEEIFARLEEIDWEPSDESIEELQERLTESEEEETPEELSTASSDELFEELKEIIDSSFPLEAVVAIILDECLSPGNPKAVYTGPHASASILFYRIYH
jgi:hypothetical protein